MGGALDRNTHDGQGLAGLAYLAAPIWPYLAAVRAATKRQLLFAHVMHFDLRRRVPSSVEPERRTGLYVERNGRSGFPNDIRDRELETNGFIVGVLDPAVEVKDFVVEMLDPAVEVKDFVVEMLDPAIEVKDFVVEMLDPAVEILDPAVEILDHAVEILDVAGI
jgi:hypothetical protein